MSAASVIIIIICALFFSIPAIIMYYGLSYINDVFNDESENKHDIQQ